jgi:hypothetical protein
MTTTTLLRRGPMACLLTVALATTACGGSSTKGTAGGATSTPAATTSAPAAATSAGTTTSTGTTAPPATTGAVSPSSPAAGTTTTGAAPTTTKLVATKGGDFCKNIASAVNNPINPSSTSSLKDQKDLIQKSLAQGAEALSKAPKEIRPDAVIVLNAVSSLFKALEKANYDYTKIDQTALASLSSPAVTAAEARLAAFVKTDCGFNLG